MPNSKENKYQVENFRERTETEHAPHSFATGQSQCKQTATNRTQMKPKPEKQGKRLFVVERHRLHKDRGQTEESGENKGSHFS
jgi:hypothetical protein